jgi:hypothetical protein
MLLTQLRDYQTEAVSRALEHDGFGLFGEQRTGKTLIALTVLDIRKPAKLIIVCPKRAIPEWDAQIKEHLRIDWPLDIQIINYGMLLEHKDEWLKRNRNGEWRDHESFMILDESHLIKRRGAAQSRLMRRLSQAFKYRLALTGTPISPKKLKRGRTSYIVKGLEDVWAQFNFIDPTVFGDYAGFEDRYCVKGGFKNYKIIAYKDQAHFDRLFREYSYRRTLKEVSKHVLKINTVRKTFELMAHAKERYKQMEQNLETVINQQVIKTPLVLSASMKLQQITGGFLIDTETGLAHPTGNEKLSVLRKMLEKKAKGETWIVVIRYRHELTTLEALAGELKLSHRTIAGGKSYQKEDYTGVDLIILQIASGVAIDLSVASTTVFYSWDYSYINFEQSKFRMISYDKKEITYYFLIARNTIDELFYESITTKKDLAQLVCDAYRIADETPRKKRA